MTADLLNMTPEQRHRYDVTNITKQVSEVQDFEKCKEYYKKYLIYYPECGGLIITKLLTLSKNEGYFHIDRIKELVELFEKFSCYWQEFLLAIFHNFDQKFIDYYESCNSIEKNTFIINEAKINIAKIKDWSRLTSLYPAFINIFPNLKEDIENNFISLCYKNGKLDSSKANSFAKIAGKDNPHIRYIIGEFTKKCFNHFLISAILLSICICIVANTEQWWVVGIFGVAILSLASATITFLINLFSAIGNHFKEKDFNFNLVVAVYEKKKGKRGYKAVEIE